MRWRRAGFGSPTPRRGCETARREFENAIELDSSEVEPLLILAVLFDKAGNKPLALRYYQQFLAKASALDYAALIPKVRAAVQDLKQ
jgi:hypothetical protein